MPRSPRHQRMLQAMGLAVAAARVVPTPTAAGHATPLETPVPHAVAKSVGSLAAEPKTAPKVEPKTAPKVAPNIAPKITPASLTIQARANTSEALDALGWEPLRQAVADCRACELCSTRQQTVFGAGHHAAHWMIVGEAPGETEDQQGEPFVGESGRLLDAMLHALQLTRGDGAPSAAQQVYIANALKCRPPKNRNPKPEEMAQCEPFLMRQLALVKPRVIVAMGRFAVQSLLRTDEAIGRLRGHVHQLNGTPLVVTYHPAYLLRNPIDKARAWDDWCLAAQVVG
jgi:uracil-DNA glycosylase